VLSGLLRSKGFVWVAFTDQAALYYSHAGRSLTIQCMGRWWASVPESEWPQDRKDDILGDFDGEFGDRRNEVVFIGVGLYDQAKQAVLRRRLDDCLLTEEELRVYREKKDDPNALFDAFPNRIEIEMDM
jgi:G3E family GTPase